MIDSKKVYMILTNGFDPDIRVYKEAKYLVSKGYDVEILCWDRKCIYKDRECEEIDGIKIKRFFIPSVPGSGMKQIFPYLKFMKCVKKYLKNKTYTYLHCHDLDGAIIGMTIKKRKNKKIVFDMHEFYQNKNNVIINFIIGRFVKYCQNRAYKIIHVNEQQIKNVNERNIEKLICLPNYPEAKEMSNVNHIVSDVLRITYAGYVRHLNPMKNLILAADKLENVKVSIHGTGQYYSEIKELSDSLKNVEVTGSFNHKEIINFYSNTDLIYCVYNKGNLNDATALPTKLFEAIICKIPIIVAKNSYMEQFVKEHDIGYSVDGESVDEIKILIEKILKDRKNLNIKRKNIEKISNNFIWENAVREMDKIYE